MHAVNDPSCQRGFRGAKPGDPVWRYMAGMIFKDYQVHSIKGNIVEITTGPNYRHPIDPDKAPVIWKFEYNTGIELDDMIGPAVVSIAGLLLEGGI